MWVPVKCEEIQIKARDSVRDIVNELQALETCEMPAVNLCEHALLYAYLGLDRPSEGWHEKSLDYLNLAIERLNILPPSHNGLYGGLAGIGWLVQHVITMLCAINREECGPGSDDEEDALSEVDIRLLDQFKIENNRDHNYDLISGIVGIGIYWIERLPRNRAILGIQETVEALKSISIETSSGITWFTPSSLIPPPQKESAPSGYYNLGVAHGVPGVISFLAQAASQELNNGIKEKASMLLEGSVKWLLSQQRPLDSLSRYSSWITSRGDCGDSRLAWCYGDLGIAAILQFVAQRTQNSIWMAEANSIANKCVLRKARTGVFDAPLCHGALGIAHIYNRMFQSHRHEIFEDESISWALRGMNMRKQGLGIAGYYAWNPDRTPPEYTNTSFLSGAIGVALVLLSFISSNEPKWDRLMLLSGVQSTDT